MNQYIVTPFHDGVKKLVLDVPVPKYTEDMPAMEALVIMREYENRESITCANGDEWKDGERVSESEFERKPCKCKIGNDCPHVKGKWMSGCVLAYRIKQPAAESKPMDTARMARKYDRLISDLPEPEGKEQKPRCRYELFVEKYFGLPADFDPDTRMKLEYSDFVNLLAMFAEQSTPSPSPSIEEAAKEYASRQIKEDFGTTRYNAFIAGATSQQSLYDGLQKEWEELRVRLTKNALKLLGENHQLRSEIEALKGENEMLRNELGNAKLNHYKQQ
jgi:hypothetical protein